MIPADLAIDGVLSSEDNPGGGLERVVKRLGREVGFDLVRIGPAGDMHRERSRYLEWIADGRQAGMRWITPDRAVRASSPGTLLPDAQAVISLGLAYGSGLRPRAPAGTGHIARYAWGEDYHRVLGDMLKEYRTRLATHFGGEYRWYVDTGPAMDKAFAQRSGLGWYGKNTNILTQQFGSYVLLGEVITTLALRPDPALNRDCGSCSLCMAACPTGALGPDYTIDSRKCISYLTIEHRGPIPLELRPVIGRWVFGCDICQDVCPPTNAPYLGSAAERRRWAAEARRAVANARSRPGPDEAAGDVEQEAPEGERRYRTRLYAENVRTDVDLKWLLRLSHDEYVNTFRGSSIRRAKVWMLRRNAAVALGNTAGADAMPALWTAMLHDAEPAVRGHAAWAIAQIARREKLDITDELSAALPKEADETVRVEIDAALSLSRTPVI